MRYKCLFFIKKNIHPYAMANDLTDIHMPDLIGLRINVNECEFRIGVSIQLKAIRRAIKIKQEPLMYKQYLVSPQG